ncbi:hypothetical protein GALL_489950 [mine drainage metagenome]|uniref:Uncharacterized protein n=1 Tax=mine drainage metagenome TaxID=410659 RepID=A0A1J5PDJ0_9ZZZZ
MYCVMCCQVAGSFFGFQNSCNAVLLPALSVTVSTPARLMSGRMALGMFCVLPEMVTPALLTWVVPGLPSCRSRAQFLKAKSDRVLASAGLSP